MFDPNLLQQELAKATDLITKSKTVITDYRSKIKEHEATIAAHEATIAANQLEIQNTANIVSTVSAISSKFTENFADFENFLANVVPAAPAPVVVPPVVVVPIPEPVAPEPVVETPVVSPAPVVVDHSLEPTRIGPLAV